MFKQTRIFALLLALLLPLLPAAAQNVAWSSSVEALGSDEYRIVLTAAIPTDYHMYDMGPYGTNGPTATTLLFTPGEGAELVGAVELLTPPDRHHDEMFDMEIGTLENRAVFAQQVRLTAARSSVAVDIEWMICNDTSCSPPDDLHLEIAVPAASAPAAKAEERIAAQPATATAAPKDAAGDKGLWALIVEAVIWGFAALLTPCVFPMVPMTVSFFMKSAGSPALGRIRAGMYGFFIVALYTLPVAAIILVTRLVGGDAVTADLFNWLATHWLPNLVFFLVFMIFAASFFGAFEITLPSWMVNKSDSKADSRGLTGIFFMALTLVLVSFSCTGPIIGTLLVEAASQGDVSGPALGMGGFALGLALPFALFAFFPSMLKEMPRSGGWLNSVKVVLGFVELILSLKFLSVADLAYGWHILDREVFVAIWIVLFILLGLYLLGKLRFSHDSPAGHTSVGGFFLAVCSLSFAVYLLPGLWGAPLKAISAFAPPLHTQDFNLYGGEFREFDDYDEGMRYAAEHNKPVLVDFSGYACVNCRKMEGAVFDTQAVRDAIENGYVLIKLMVDDKARLAAPYEVEENGRSVEIATVGDRWSYLQRHKFGSATQPYYVMLDNAGMPLGPSRSYDENAEAFMEWLSAGIAAYNK